MLSISLTTQAEYFASTISVDYYSSQSQSSGGGEGEVTEPLGTWFGKGASALGLPQGIEREAYLRVFEGFHPHQPEQKLVQNAGPWQRSNPEGQSVQRRRPAWDLTFSAPKSISVLFALGDSQVRDRLLQAQAEAVSETLNFLEDRLAFGRRGKDGHRREAVGLVVGRFTHITSREGDPQLHTHSVVLNLGHCQDNKIVALDPLGFYRYKLLLGALYRASLAAHVKQHFPQLPLRPTELKRGHSFELGTEVMPQSVLKGFSKRSEQINQTLTQRGIDPEQASAELREQATLSSRQRKDPEEPLETLLPRWRTEAQTFGLDLKPEGISLAALDQQTQKAVIPSDQALKDTLDTLTSRWSFFTGSAVLTGVLERSAAHGIPVTQSLDQVEQWLAGSAPQFDRDHPTHQAVRLQDPLVTGKRGHLPIRDPLVTTQGLLHLEQQMLTTADKLAQTVPQPLTLDPQQIEQHSQAQNLTPEQHHVLTQLLQANSNLRLLHGVPGAGKTALLSVASQLWQDQHRPVLALALQGRTAEDLGQRTHAPAQTLHHLLQHSQHQPLPANSILIVDEASMVETPLLAPLIQLAHHSSATLILVGDPHQLPAIGPGGGFTHLLNTFPNHTQTLGTPLRQQIPWQQQATLALAHQDMDTGLQAYADHGCLHLSPTPSQTLHHLIQTWANQGGANQPQEHLIVAMTNHDVDQLNQLAQAQRLQQGQLEASQHLTLNNNKLYSGDWVVIRRDPNTPETERIPYQRYGVKNGSLGQIERITPHSNVLHLRLENGQPRSLPLDHFPHIRLAYAGTTHLLQGRSAEQVFILMGGAMQDREQTLVQLTRHKQQVQMFVAEDWLQDQGLTPLLEAINRTRAKTLALSQQTPQPEPQQQQQQLLL